MVQAYWGHKERKVQYLAKNYHSTCICAKVQQLLTIVKEHNVSIALQSVAAIL